MTDYKAVAASLRACRDPQKHHAADMIDALREYAEQIERLARAFADEYAKEFYSHQSIVEKWTGWVDGFDSTSQPCAAYLALRDALAKKSAGERDVKPGAGDRVNDPDSAADEGTRTGSRPEYPTHSSPEIGRVKYERHPELDMRIERGDAYAGDAWVRWVAVGQRPDEGRHCFIARNGTDDNCPPGECAAIDECQRDEPPLARHQVFHDKEKQDGR